MRSHNAEYKTFTTGSWDFVDITNGLQDLVVESGIETGRVTVLSPDEDCTLVVNERESGLRADIKSAAERLAERDRLLGARSVVLPFASGRLQLGAWQRVMLVELGPEATSRSVTVQVVGE